MSDAIVRVFATADLHLGMTFGAPLYDELRDRLTEARFAALERMVELSNERSCDLFVVAGDLFESRKVSKGDVKRALEILGGLEARCVFVLPGNHDYHADASGAPWSGFVDGIEGSSVPIVLAVRPDAYPLDRYGLPVTVLASPCTAKHSDESPAARAGALASTFAGDSAKDLMLGVVHGAVQGLSPDFDKRYYPMTSEELDSPTVDAWIIGHTHVQHPGDGDGRVFVPGTPEPDGFDCSHEGTAWYLELRRSNDGSGSPKVEISATSLTTGRYRFVRRDLAVSDLSGLRRALEAIPEERRAATLFDLRLSGTLERSDYDEIQPFIDSAREQYALLRVDYAAVAEAITVELVREQFPDESFPSRLLLSFLEERDAEAAQTAYALFEGAGR